MRRSSSPQARPRGSRSRSEHRDLESWKVRKSRRSEASLDADQRRLHSGSYELDCV
jgi:hypothetical protein